MAPAIAFAVILYLALGWLFGSWARLKGYPFLTGFLLGILTTPIVAAIVLATLPSRALGPPAPRPSADDKGVAAIAQAYKRAHNTPP
jgi:hypothetical protein